MNVLNALMLMMTAGRTRMEQSGERPAWPLLRRCAPAQAGHGAGAVLGGAALGQAVGRVPGRPASIQRVLAVALRLYSCTSGVKSTAEFPRQIQQATA